MTPADTVLSMGLSMLMPENILLEATRRYFAQEYPGAPVDWAVKHAINTTNGLVGEVAGPLGPLARRLVLTRQLDRSEKYLAGMAQFLGLDSGDSTG